MFHVKHFVEDNRTGVKEAELNEIKYLKYFWENVYKPFDMNLISQAKSIFDYNIEGPEIFLSFLHADSHILDFGCGFGRNTIPLLKKGFTVSVSDISEGSMNICEENALMHGYHIHKIQYDGRLHCKDDMFDGIILWSVLDHMTLGRAKDIISEMGRVCKSDAVLLCSFDGKEDINKSMYKENEDGSIVLTKGKNKGMILRFFSNEEILSLFMNEWEVLYFCGINPNCEKVIICRKKSHPSHDIYKL